MSAFYRRDQILVTPITKAAGTGAITRGAAYYEKVMIEEETNMISGGSGRDVQSDIYIFASPKTTIKKGDIIQVTKKFGKTITGDPERIVLQTSPYGSRTQSHMEIYA